MGAFDLIAKAAKGVKKAPFFSKVDEVLDSLPRNKGTGDEFLREIEKTKGVKPAEIQDRGIAKALKGKPKMTKAEVQKIFESNPPPRVQEKVLSDTSPDYEDFLEAKAQEEYGVDWFDLSRQEKARLEKMFKELPTTQYEQYKTPGGENYREILLKLPKRGLTKMEQDELMLYEADLRRTNGQATPQRMARYQELKAKEPDNATNYTSGHYREDPNLLAHIRVQDFQAPTRGFAVVNTRSGNRSEVFPSVEQAQAYLSQMPENMQGMLRIDEAAGKPKKVLLVDEIQSDWHQEGRKKGYKQEPKKSWLVKKPGDTVHGSYDSEEEAANAMQSLARAYGEEPRRLGLSIEEGVAPDYSGAVPDAPFKKNWHELAMKRVLDYAAENGYDSIAITPGAEQAKRYDLSKQLSRVAYREGRIQGYDPDGALVISKSVEPKDLPDFVGKELGAKMAENAQRDAEVRQAVRQAIKDDLPEDQIYALREQLNAIPDEYSGLDLQVGGEGMKGFYDKILPDYLNNFGKQYGASVREAPLNYTPSTQRVAQGAQDDALLGQLGVDVPTVAPTQYHMFDITPQLRDEVKNKGLPLYGKMGMGPEGLAAGTGAATIGSQMFDENNEQQVQNPVHFTENPDAMLLELMQRN
jgi:hypothetical protein